MNEAKKIFKKSSKTYYNAAILFPKEISKDVQIIYGFVRKADNFADNIPSDAKGLKEFEKEFEKCLKTSKSKDEIVQDFCDLYKAKKFQKKWVEAFFSSMKQDLKNPKMKTYKETKKYIYGSAEVIGLMMAKTIGVKKEGFPYAKKLGEAMQLINMIRDVDEDNKLGRQYLPINEMKGFELSPEYANTKPFKKYIKKQLERYKKSQKEAQKGYKYIPKNCLPAIKTAADMYKWTAKQIEKNPSIIFQKKVKPSKTRVILTGIKNKLL